MQITIAKVDKMGMDKMVLTWGQNQLMVMCARIFQKLPVVGLTMPTEDRWVHRELTDTCTGIPWLEEIQMKVLGT